MSGHHGVSREGEFVLFDVAKGRHETSGVVQRIPGYGQTVEPVIADNLVGKSYPRFLYPYPLSDKYFLVSCKPTPGSSWGIYLVDVFDNMLLLKEQVGYAFFEPIPLRRVPTPRVIPDRVDLARKDATIYLQDIYYGNGLKGVPRGAVKKLRVIRYVFGYRSQPGYRCGHACMGVESSWDAKRVLGTVPVEEDGSAIFTVPASTPIAIQPLDENGAALQLMRSWMVAMPGETLSCIGCHESQNDVPIRRATIASQRAPREITPYNRERRTFGYRHDVQPVLDKYCVGCHDGKKADRPNFADRNVCRRGFTESYHALNPFLRRPGPESDVHMFKPMEYHVSTSELFQMLEKGHHNVRIDDKAYAALATWADLNVPFFATWREYSGTNVNAIAERSREMRRLYSGICEDLESLPPESDAVAYVAPETPGKNAPPCPSVRGWPFDQAAARKKQDSVGGSSGMPLDLGAGLTMQTVRIPAGEFVMGDADATADERPCVTKIAKPFWIGRFEVSNEQYSRFDAAHDSRYIDQQGKDLYCPGYPVNKPGQPVVRVSWVEAIEFCDWLGEKTGRKVTLPTEAQWEWACRAGTDTPFHFGDREADFGRFANLADSNMVYFTVKGVVNRRPVKKVDRYNDFIPRVAGVDDGAMVSGDTGKYVPNAWGLHDMHGNAAEWTRSAYMPYPYRHNDGRNATEPRGRKIVRGGSWRDRPYRATSAYRLAYRPCQKVFNVGFRVVIED